MEFLTWMEMSPLSNWLLGDPYAVQLLLCAHSVGMAIVVGVVMILNVRVLGYAKGMPVSIFNQAITLAWWGFAINAVSGVVLFCTNGTKLALLWTFQLKLLLILAGGMSVWLLWRSARLHPEQGHDFNRREKAIALISLVFWLGALAAGRYIAYTIS